MPRLHIGIHSEISWPLVNILHHLSHNFLCKRENCLYLPQRVFREFLALSRECWRSMQQVPFGTFDGTSRCIDSKTCMYDVEPYRLSRANFHLICLTLTYDIGIYIRSDLIYLECKTQKNIRCSIRPFNWKVFNALW